MTLDLSFPRSLYLDMYLSDDWQSIPGSHVLQNEEISIERGVPNENDEAPPATLVFTLNDSADKGNGDYNPYNPLGQYHGQLTRNVPTRFGLNVGADAFTRSVGSGWGTSPDNGAWTAATAGGTAATSVTSNAGQHSITTAGASAITYLAGVAIRDIEIVVDVTLSDANLTGGFMSAGVVLRGQDTSNFMSVALVVNPDETVDLWLLDTPSTFAGGVVELSPIYTYSGQQWTIRAQIEGRTLRGKAWPAASVEPLDWQGTAVVAEPYGAGWVGIRTTVDASNSDTKPLLANYDNLALRLMRFEGEATKFVPNADPTMTRKTTAVTCSDITQRLAQGTSAIKSAMRRTIPGRAGIIAYWPMEDGKFAKQFESATARGTPMKIQEGTAHFAEDDSFANSLPLPQMANSTARTGVPSHATPVTYVLRSLFFMPAAGGISIFGWRLWTTGTIHQWLVQPSGGTPNRLGVYAYDNNSAVVFDDANNPDINDDHIYFSFAMSQNGADIDYSLSLIKPGDDTSTAVTSGTVAGRQMGRVYAVELIFTGTENPDAIVGHVSLGNVAESLTLAAPYVSAYAGDTVAERIARLLSDNGIPPCADLYEITGGSDTMGPMFPDTLLNSIEEAAATDHGIRFSPKGDRTISYRRLDSLYDQEPMATLDHTTHELQPGFRPVNDDFRVRNAVTVQRRGGESVEYVVDEGPNNANDPGTADGAVGRYDTSYQVNCEDAEQALSSAGWLAHLGTAAEPRFPLIPVELSANALRDDADLQGALLDCGPGDVIRLTNLTKWGIYDPNDVLALSYSERFDTMFRHVIDFNAVPAKPYTVGRLDDGAIRLDSASSTGAATMTATTGSQSMSVATSDAEDLWITTASDPADFPFDITRAGERMTVTAITGATSPQTFTVTRGVNGVVKMHAVGEKVSLADPYFIAR